MVIADAAHKTIENQTAVHGDFTDSMKETPTKKLLLNQYTEATNSV
jgi:hypothetical protein